MPHNLSWLLYLLLHLPVAAVLFVAVLLAMNLTAAEGSLLFLALPAVATVLFLCLTLPPAYKMYAQYPGFVGAMEQTAPKMLKWFLIPLGAFIGGQFAKDLYGLHPLLGWLLGGGILLPLGIPFFLWLFRPDPPPPSSDPDFIRGTAKMTIQEAIERAQAIPSHPREPRLCWGGIPLPERFSEGHFLALGATGSGKTATLRMLMQSIVPRIRPGSGYRALIYDPKKEFWPILSGMRLHCPVKTLHPYDTRSTAWDIAQDIDDRSTAQTLVETFIPNPGGPNQFFYQAAQGIMSAVMEAFILIAPYRWTLRDVMLAMRDVQVLKRLLRTTPETETVYLQYIKGLHAKTRSDVLATIAAQTRLLDPIAALWSFARDKISLKEWANESYILLFAKDSRIAEPLDNVNRVLFQRVSQIFTNQGAGRTWVFIDEAKFAGKIPGLDDLLTTGRTFGVRVVIATQDLSGFRHVYGPDTAEELLGGSGNKAIFGTWNPSTAKYASEVMGKTERIERTATRTYTEGKTIPETHKTYSNSVTENEQIVQREAVMPEQFQQLYPANRRRFYGYYAVPAVGRYEGWLYHGHALRPPGREPRIIGRPPRQQYSPPWSEEDFERLGPELAALLKPEAAPSRPPVDAPSYLDEVNIPEG